MVLLLCRADGPFIPDLKPRGICFILDRLGPQEGMRELDPRIRCPTATGEWIFWMDAAKRIDEEIGRSCGGCSRDLRETVG
jgi:hypothetical protein